METNEYYFVNPESSIKFGGRWGKLSVKKDNLLPYGLLFEGDVIPYYFSRDELMNQDEFTSVYGYESCLSK